MVCHGTAEPCAPRGERGAASINRRETMNANNKTLLAAFAASALFIPTSGFSDYPGYTEHLPVWSTVASACTIDESVGNKYAVDKADVYFAGANVSKPSGANLQPLTFRCNIAPVFANDADGNPDWNALIVGLSDPDGAGTDAGVTFRLYRVGRPTGSPVAQMVAYDSNSTDLKARREYLVKLPAAQKFDFKNYEYYVQIDLYRRSTGVASPRAFSVRLSRAEDGTAPSCETLVPANFSGGCTIYLSSPANCTKPTLVSGYYEFSWSTNGTFCEGPHTLTIGGNPPSTWNQGNVLSYSISSGQRAESGMTRNIGGYLYIAPQELARLTTDNGQYHWGVSSYHGSASESRTFTVK
jgi:hypothetical protein